MRTVGNPIKENAHETPRFKRHRLIMPVFIPSEDGYYSDAFRIFEVCIESLIASIDPSRMDITVIDNGSISKVRDFIESKLTAGKIDQYIHNQVNRGKADAITSQAKAHYEPFITISDADVLFHPGWLDAIERVYAAFPDAGNVCPFPAPNLAHLSCSSSWVTHFWNLKNGAVVEDSLFRRLESTLGLSDFYSAKDKRSQWYLQKNGKPICLIGAGHFVATYRSNVFQNLPCVPSRKGLKGGLKQIEKAVDELGLSRLSCIEIHVLHMGNKFEDWMVVPPQNYSWKAEELLEKCPSTISSWIPSILRKSLEMLIASYDRLMRR